MDTDNEDITFQVWLIVFVFLCFTSECECLQAVFMKYFQRLKNGPFSQKAIKNRFVRNPNPGGFMTSKIQLLFDAWASNKLSFCLLKAT